MKVLLATLLAFSLSPKVWTAPPIDGDEAPDLIIINAKIHTVDDSVEKADAVAIKDGRFIAVGSNTKIRQIAERRTRLIDAEGRLILPGFNDSHAHLLGIGNLFSSIDLRRARGQKDFQDEVARFTQFLPKGRWIQGGRWDPALLDGPNSPSRRWIDDVSPDNPALLYSTDPSVALANSAALELAGITSDTSGPSGGEIIKDEDGKPTGILKGNAITIVRSLTRLSSFDDRLQVIQTATNYAVSFGITSLQDMSTDDNTDVITELDKRGLLKARIYDCTGLTDWKTYADRNVKAAQGTPMLRTGCLKSFTDGSETTIPGFYEQIVGADKAGMQVMIHAIGPTSNGYILSLFERAFRENGPRDRRFRVEHAQSLTRTEIPVFGRLGVIPSMQPYLFRGSGPYRSLLRSGARIAFGSDAMITDIDPLLGISVATESKPRGTSEKLTVEEAIRLYTLGAAYAEFQDKEKGSITVGKLADLIILSDDIFKMEPSKVRNVRVLTTIVGGKVVYRAPESR